MANHTQLHFLVNNAGIHYVSTEGNPLTNLSYPVVSPQVRPNLTHSLLRSLASLFILRTASPQPPRRFPCLRR